jgi:hypothetical protein
MTVTLQIAACCGVAIGLLWGCGFLPARLLLPWRLRPFTVLLAPFLGLGVVSSLAHYLSASGLPLRRTAWLFVVVAAAGWVAALRRPPRRPPRQVLAALAIVLLAFGLAVSPLLRLGYLTTVGTTSDALSYVARGEYFQDAPLARPELIPGFPHLTWVHSQFFLRVGDVYLLGLLGLLTGQRSFELLTVTAALFFALTAGAAFAWGRGTLRLPRDAALLGALLVALSNLLLWAVYGDFFSQAVGCALVLPVVGSGIEAGRRPSWRSAALFGLLEATLVSIYPIYACFAALFVALLWAVEIALRRHGRPRAALRRLGWGLAAAGLALACNGVALAHSVKELRFLAGLAGPLGAEAVGRGDVRICPAPTEITGLSAHAGMVYGAPAFELAGPPLLVAAMLLCGFALYGWWRLGARARIAAGVVLGASVALAAWQRWILDQPWCYAYGYYKVVSIVALAFLPVAAAGLAAAWRDRRWRWIAAPLALLVVGLNLWQAAWTADYAFDRVIVDRRLIAAARVATAQPSGSWVWIDVARSLRQNWLAYLIQRHPLLFRDKIFMLSPGPLDPAARADYGVIERGLDERQRDALDEPWYNPTISTRIWRNDQYELRRRAGSSLATLRFARAAWPPATALEVALDGGPAGFAEVRFAGAAERVRLAGGGPRHIQLFLFSAAPAADLAVEGAGGAAGAPMSLGPGGYLLDLDLGCVPSGASRIVFRHRAGALFLRRWQATAADVPRRGGGCLQTVPLQVGMGYVEQRVISPGQIEYAVTLLAPPGAGERTYRLGLHAVQEKTAKLYGVWSIDFAANTRVQEALLRLDLGRRTAQATADEPGAGDHPLRVEITSLIVDQGDFESDAVWWQFNPLKQVLIDPILWFSRHGTAVEVTRTAAGGRMAILQVP